LRFGSREPARSQLEAFLSVTNDRAEQIFTGQLSEQTFRLRPRYLEVVKESLAKRMDSEAIGDVVWLDQSGRGIHCAWLAGTCSGWTGITEGTAAGNSVHGQEYFGLTNSAALRLPEFSIYTVVKAVNSDQAQSIYCNYDNPINWGKGVNLQLTQTAKCASLRRMARKRTTTR